MSETGSTEALPGKPPARRPGLRPLLAAFQLGQPAVRGAAAAMVVLAVASGAYFMIDLLAVDSPHWFAAAVFLVLLLLLVALANLIGTVILPRLAGWILRQPRGFLWALLAAVFMLLLHFLGGPSYWPLVAGIILLALLAGAGAGALAGGRWKDLRAARRLAAAAFLLAGAGGLLALLVLLAFPGQKTQPAAWAQPNPARPVLPLSNPAKSGDFEVETYTYGSGVDRRRPEFAAHASWTTPSVDASKMISGWNGLTALGRKLYWGFDDSQLPLNGRVWAPAGEGPFPLVLAVHGNHTAEEFSDPGYAYLGELLASRGFIVVSVDENFLNTAASDLFFGPALGIKGENDARGWLLLEHLSQWRGWNTKSGHPFEGRVDLERIALIGHSRGGEAVAVAAAFNRLPAYPDDARMDFDYGFNIRAVIAIAPVDGQYWPGQVPTPLQDVSYFTIHGSHDGDMRSFHGLRQYERVTFTRPGEHFKAALYVYRANHGQFNTVWGGQDKGGLTGLLLNRQALLAGDVQRQIAAVYFSAFLEATLHGEDGYRALFSQPGSGKAWLPETGLVSRYSDGSEQPLANFEEDLDVRSGSWPGVTLSAEGFAGWREQRVSLKWGALESKGVYLRWEERGEPAVYQAAIEPGARLAEASQLVFDLADSGEGEPKGIAREPLDLTIRLTDRDGDTAELPLSHISALQPQLEGQVSKLPFTDREKIFELVPQSYAFALDDFQAQNPAFDPGTLAAVTFRFDRSPAGAVMLDGLALR